MHKKRLKQLRRVVEDAPDDRLHMRDWCDPVAPCGTAYCAAGWAAIDPWFRANTEIEEIFEVDDAGHVHRRAPVSACDRLAALFDINVDAAWKLFLSIPYGDADPHRVTKAMVLENIDRVLAGAKPVNYQSMITPGASIG